MYFSGSKHESIIGLVWQSLTKRAITQFSVLRKRHEATMAERERNQKSFLSRELTDWCAIKTLSTGEPSHSMPCRRSDAMTADCISDMNFCNLLLRVKTVERVTKLFEVHSRTLPLWPECRELWVGMKDQNNKALETPDIWIIKCETSVLSNLNIVILTSLLWKSDIARRTWLKSFVGIYCCAHDLNFNILQKLK